MNRQANDKRQTIRTLCASAALVATLVVAASIDVLARHYGAAAQLTTLEKTVTVASN